MTTDKVKLPEKLAYFCANLGNIPVMNLINSYLLIFYTNICGLDPAACATLFLLARIMDGISDPVVGFLVDRMPYTKMGRFRPTMVLGAIVCSANFLLLWFGPMMAPSGKLLIAYISYLLIGFTFDLMDIPLNSLLPVMTADTNERNTLSSIKGVGYMVGAVVVGVAAPLILGNTPTQENFTILIAIAFVFILVLTLIGAFGVKERINAAGNGSDSTYGIKELFRIFLQKPVYTTFIVILLYTIGSNIVSSAGTYYYTYILGNLSLSAVITLVSLVTILPTAIISGKFISKYGKKKIYAIGLTIAGSIGIIRLLDITSVPILIVSALLSGIGTGLVMPLNYSIQADNTNYVELSLGWHAEGAISSLSSFISKCASGIGGAIPGYLLALAGFQSELAVQPDAVNTTIIVCVVVLPAIFSLVGILIFLKTYPLTKEKLAEQNEELARVRAERAAKNA